MLFIQPSLSSSAIVVVTLSTCWVFLFFFIYLINWVKGYVLRTGSQLVDDRFYCKVCLHIPSLCLGSTMSRKTLIRKIFSWRGIYIGKWDFPILFSNQFLFFAKKHSEDWNEKFVVHAFRTVFGLPVSEAISLSNREWFNHRQKKLTVDKSIRNLHWKTTSK